MGDLTRECFRLCCPLGHWHATTVTASDGGKNGRAMCPGPPQSGSYESCTHKYKSPSEDAIDNMKDTHGKGEGYRVGYGVYMRGKLRIVFCTGDVTNTPESQKCTDSVCTSLRYPGPDHDSDPNSLPNTDAAVVSWRFLIRYRTRYFVQHR